MEKNYTEIENRALHIRDGGASAKMAPVGVSEFKVSTNTLTDIPKLGVWAGTYCHGDFG